jgi:hypothetical protein
LLLAHKNCLFARTSDDQIAPAPEKTAYIGERNTRATSDRPPDATAPPLPSQAGIEPRDEQDIETTESDYRDGSLAENPAAPPVPEMLSTPPEPEAPSPIEETTTAGSATDMPGPDSESAPPPPPRETLLDGPNPVDVQVPRETSDDESPKPTSQAPKTASLPPKPETPETPKPTETAPPKPSRDPAFSGFQRKTAVTGSISRSGRSALDVEDSALGRYQAAISRAVEQEWQRNCVRHRDFITPGFLTVRFFVEPGGKVRSVQFVGEMETGEIQKGFTLNSIRDAEIPPCRKPCAPNMTRNRSNSLPILFLTNRHDRNTQSPRRPRTTAADAFQSSWDFLLKGGLFMIPLALTSFVGMTAILYKFLSLSRSRVVPEGLARRWRVSRTLSPRIRLSPCSRSSRRAKARSPASPPWP